MVRIALLSSFPPERCGIGSYAHQQAIALEKGGHHVVRLPLGHLDAAQWSRQALDAWRPELELADRIVLHYQHGLYHAPGRLWVVRMWRGHARLRRLLRPYAGKLEAIVHEPPDPQAVWPVRAATRLAGPRLLRLASSLTFHTRTEADAFSRRFFAPAAIRIEPHHAAFQAAARATRAEARARLGVPAGEATFLCIGYYHVAKGFEACAQAFGRLAQAGRLPPEARLRIVTSLRERASSAALEDLQRLAGPAVEVQVGYVDDATFDLWLQACDVLVVPYVASGTSGVLGRAALFGTPAIVSAVGGLGEQAGPSATLVHRPEELEAALVRHAAALVA